MSSLPKKRKRFLATRKQIQTKIATNYLQSLILCIGIVVCLTVYFVWRINMNAYAGYGIRGLEVTYEELSIQRNYLQTRIAEIESLKNITEDESITMVPIGRNIEYIQSATSTP